jgi:hypothetical protein
MAPTGTERFPLVKDRRRQFGATARVAAEMPNLLLEFSHVNVLR